MPRFRIEKPQQKIILGDCLDVFANERNVHAFVSDPPANIGFMGRSWDCAHPVNDFVLPNVPRSKAHESEWRRKEAFIRYWSTRYAMAYDIADQHAMMILWTLPRTSHQTAEALERAGWTIKDNLVHLFGSGWMKSKRTNDDGERVPAALAPGQEGWLLATKGKPDLDIDACRVPRGERPNMVHNGVANNRLAFAGQSTGATADGTTSLGSLPKNALLSHCEECVRVGTRNVKASTGTTPGNFLGIMNDDGYKPKKVPIVRHGISENGTESVPAWHCLAGCVCGARSKWDPEKPLPRCPCGEVWRWICPVAEVNEQSGNRPGMNGGGKHREGNRSGIFGMNMSHEFEAPYADQGGASRFFNTFSYLSKCSSSERHAGCENLYWRANKKNPFGFDQITREEYEANLVWVERKTRGKVERVQVPRKGYAQGNVHPTVKSYRLMHWLHSITGADKIVDLCAGSGTGMFTAALDGIEWIGAEVCPEAVTIAQARHAFWSNLHRDAVAAFMDQRPMKRILEIQNKATS